MFSELSDFMSQGRKAGRKEDSKGERRRGRKGKGTSRGKGKGEKKRGGKKREWKTELVQSTKSPALSSSSY